MFSRLSSMLHHAVEAFAPNLPPQQEFVAHWKAVTHYFVDNKDHKISVDQTSLPKHLDRMILILIGEEQSSESGISGPAMEYLLHHKILETLYTLARTDCPPGMKQVVLQFFTKLLSRIKQPLLPHVNVHKPIQKVVRLCGEVLAGPAETEEMQLLLTICAKLKTDTYLVNFFIENGTVTHTKPSGAPISHVDSTSSFQLISSLLMLMQSPDARVAVKACEGLMLCSTLSEPVAAKAISTSTTFCQRITEKLCGLYDKLPAIMDPADIESVEAKWGLDVMCDHDDHLTFAGKRQIISFLSWLDYCDQLVQVAHPEVATALAKQIREQYMEKVLEPKLLQTSEGGAITATAHLCLCIRLVSSWTLLAEFVYFTLGGERSPETLAVPSSHKLRHKLLERCNHLSEELSITTLKLFETLLLKENDFVTHNLILRNLLGRTYYDQSKDNVQSQTCENSVSDNTSSSHKTSDDSKVEEANVEIENSIKDERIPEDHVEDRNLPECSKAAGSLDVLSQSSLEEQLVSDKDQALENGPLSDLSPHSSTEFDGSVPSSPGCHSQGSTDSVHHIVNSFLHIVPEEAKSSYETGDTGYDTYLRDAHRQYAELGSMCHGYQWPHEPVCDPAYITQFFYEGAFLKMLFDKMSAMLDQSYDVNLQVTSLVSRLALMPHPNLHEYLLNPYLPLPEGNRNLSSILHKLSNDIQTRMKTIHDFPRRLLDVRRDLMGFTDNLRRSPSTASICIEDGDTLAGVIVLEEFCKELAAIAFVKSYGV